MALPQFRPLELQQVASAFDDPDWIFEIKYDGFRALAHFDGGACEFVSRNSNVLTRFDELVRLLPEDLGGTLDAVLDGELVVLDGSGASRFDDLLLRRRTPIFAAFDLLWLGGVDLRNEPLLERKKRLRDLLAHDAKRVLYVDHVREYGRALYAYACERDLEGIVAKPAISRYAYVRDRSPWLKIKNPSYTRAEGRGELFSRRAQRR